VARLAGLPAAVVSRAREVLKVHERAESSALIPEPKTPNMQMTMFTPLSQKIVDRIGQVDVDEMTPREALNLLAELQRELKA
jgi:DNA mismatch repair protein MutS